ncbi:uncharacterized protein I303_106159 [Kwoniella dejecticola CBS 10117]|uniref:Uncharacterized protein n=1 Tax=Kwoniella dejecticola CBS 10117 TaxID=1296121 RepID=A0A1A6A1F9_9TREE|nr:uncharacterized protein I303_06177 [Kwoniella dejecticola CBS 10117]OBR83892.1 hypothetical protein I303_06177 [Kwoniella dejecticola CBS 10117]
MTHQSFMDEDWQDKNGYWHKTIISRKPVDSEDHKDVLTITEGHYPKVEGVFPDAVTLDHYFDPDTPVDLGSSQLYFGHTLPASAAATTASIPGSRVIAVEYLNPRSKEPLGLGTIYMKPDDYHRIRTDGTTDSRMMRIGHSDYCLITPGGYKEWQNGEVHGTLIDVSQVASHTVGGRTLGLSVQTITEMISSAGDQNQRVFRYIGRCFTLANPSAEDREAKRRYPIGPVRPGETSDTCRAFGDDNSNSAFLYVSRRADTTLCDVSVNQYEPGGHGWGSWEEFTCEADNRRIMTGNIIMQLSAYDD